VTAGEPRPFTFAELDGLGFAAAKGRLQPLPDGAYVARDLGPVLELARLSASGLLPAPTRANWLALAEIEAFGTAWRERRKLWTCPQRGLGFLRLEPEPPEDETEGIAFSLEAQKAAAAAGLPGRLPAWLVGAFNEMQSNVYEHSGRPATGVAAYRATGGRFEFVVSDGGMGPLASLASGPDYPALHDHAEALRLTLTDGISRHGRAAGRGTGFRRLFTGLAELGGALRFRSGDQALTIDGVNPAAMPWKTAEKPSMGGFLAAVCCSVPKG
jgi:anti-sigma regulatory factor (Ser/Thr protein kinase)